MSAKLFAPSAERNKEPILSVLQRFLQPKSLTTRNSILEVSSGTGQHVEHFARGLPEYTFIPSEYTTSNFDSIKEYAADLGNVVLPPLLIDASSDTWHQNVVQQQNDIHAIVNINMIHISPFECTVGLMRGASYLLQSGGYLFTYGPYNVDHKFTSEGNEKFHQDLISRNPQWGIRDVSDVEREANKHMD